VKAYAWEENFKHRCVAGKKNSFTGTWKREIRQDLAPTKRAEKGKGEKEGHHVAESEPALKTDDVDVETGKKSTGREESGTNLREKGEKS